MWLVIDIGNTNIKVGFYDAEKYLGTVSINANKKASIAAYRHTFRAHLKDKEITRIGIVSVVPILTEKVQEALRKETLVYPEVIHRGLHKPIDIAYKSNTLGNDRWVVSVGAVSRFFDKHPASNLIIVDCGTAINYEVVTPKRVYLGGAIAPGPTLAIKALNSGTAQLPLVEPKLPKKAIGFSTKTSLTSGLMFGLVDQVSGMINRIKSELDGEAIVISTGGWGFFLKEHITSIQYHDPHLVLQGVYYLLKMNPSL